MTIDETMAALRAAGSEQTRKTYARHGVTREMFGVSFAAFEKLRKKIKADHRLAQQLWETGNHDARILATMIADPRLSTASLLNRWLRQVDHQLISWGVARLAGKSPAALKCFEKWSRTKSEWAATTGWTLLAELAKDPLQSDDLFSTQFPYLQRHIHDAPNRARYAMNNAVIAIGCRGGSLQTQAIATAKRIGKVEVDHGDTACTTPDAAAYIQRTAERKSQRSRLPS